FSEVLQLPVKQCDVFRSELWTGLGRLSLGLRLGLLYSLLRPSLSIDVGLGLLSNDFIGTALEYFASRKGDLITAILILYQLPPFSRRCYGIAGWRGCSLLRRTLLRLHGRLSL